MDIAKLRTIALLMLTAFLVVSCSSAGTNGDTDPTTSASAAPQCPKQKLDLAETAFGLWLQGRKIPQQEAGLAWDFEVLDNHFDPCAKLSWVTLRGVSQTVGEEQQSAWDDATQTVVFFHYDKLITDVHQLVAPQIGKIKVEPDMITVEFAEFSPNYPREWHGDWEAITYKLKGDKLEQKTDPILDIRALDLDFGKNPPPSSHSVISPYGNVHQKPWDYEVKSGVLARVPMDDTQILCDIAHKPNEIHCQNQQESTWPLIAPPNDDAGADRGNGDTNHAHIIFGTPNQFYTSFSFPSNTTAGELIADEAVTKVGQYLIDTRGDNVKISNNAFTVTLASGVAVAEQKPLVKLDTSRFPNNLAPWE